MLNINGFIINQHVFLITGVSEDGTFWNAVEWKSALINKVMSLISSACQMTSKIRPVTVELAITLLLQLTQQEAPSEMSIVLDDVNLALLEQAKEECTMVARTFFKVSKNWFLEILTNIFRVPHKFPRILFKLMLFRRNLLMFWNWVTHEIRFHLVLKRLFEILCDFIGNLSSFE